MKLARCTDAGEVFWGVVDPDAESVAPISAAFDEWAPVLTRDPGQVGRFTGPARALGSVELLPPVDPGREVFAGGANYGKHVAELGLDARSSPTVFAKSIRSLIGARARIEYPVVTGQLDYEIELVAVVGAQVLDREDPWGSVLGYTVGNDVSARDLQFAGSVTGMDIFSAKSLKNTSPVGPWIVTRDEFGEGAPDLEMTLTVNGEIRQEARTGQMVWNVAELLTYVDDRAGVRCGDLLFTGSPAGIGHSSGRYLQPGDRVVGTIERLGSLVNEVGPDPRA
ncbi:MAG TPA: fumarylacetoacetate hydrolase family protein [Pseudonocardia sp.]|nr:fumarylacetoacetate hydrolase family protein [Pseudonocardia sp.]